MPSPLPAKLCRRTWVEWSTGKSLLTAIISQPWLDPVQKSRCKDEAEEADGGNDDDEVSEHVGVFREVVEIDEDDVRGLVK